MQVIGLSVFVLAGFLLVGLVWTRSYLDRGMRERRIFEPQETEVLRWFAKFEKLGGRVQGIDALQQSDALRSKGIAWGASVQLIFAMGLTALAFVFGWSWWVPSVIVLVCIVCASYLGEYTTYLRNPEAEQWRYADMKPGLLLGLIVKTTGLCAGLGVIWVGATAAEQGRVALGLICAAGGVIIIDRAHVPARVIESWLCRRGNVEFAESTTDATILYLRSFDDDTALVYAPLGSLGWYAPFIPQRARFEELLESWTFGSAAHVVAIGRPGEPRPALGAKRTYWTDETWQAAVQQTAARCRAIILVAGVSEGLGWEISRLAHMGVLGKTLLLLPPDTPDKTQQRYERIAAATDRPGDALVKDPKALQSIPALGYTAEGDLVHYVSCGRDWAAFVLAEMHFLSTLRSAGEFESREALTTMFALTEDPVMQARFLVQDRADHQRARSLLDDALTGENSQEEADRIRVARAAADLAAGVDRPQILDWLGEPPQVAGERDSEMMVRARALLGSPACTAEDLFQLVLPDDLRPSRPARRRETMPTRTAVQLYSLLESAETLLEDGKYDESMEQARAARALSEKAGLQLCLAMADLTIAVALANLDQTDKAHALAADVVSRDLPTEAKLGLMRVPSTDVMDNAVALLLELPETDREEAVRLLERQYAFRLESGLRKEGGKTAQLISEHHLEDGDLENARRWGTTALVAFEDLGMPEEQAQSLLLLSRAGVDMQDWERAMAEAYRLNGLVEEYSFDDLRGDALYLMAMASSGLANRTGDREDRQRAMTSIETSLARERTSGSPQRLNALLDELLVQRRALDLG